jgi:hypothetical protein
MLVSRAGGAPRLITPSTFETGNPYLKRRHTCPSCGWSDTRASLRWGALDTFAGLLFLEPIRCRKCLNRFFRFSNPLARVLIPLALLAGLMFVAISGIEFVRGGFRSRPQAHTAPAAPAQATTPEPTSPGDLTPPAANGYATPLSLAPAAAKPQADVPATH